MSIDGSFKGAERAGAWSTWIFWIVTALSVVLLIWTDPVIESFLHPVLIVSAAAGVFAGMISSHYQNQGNGMLRAAQLRDAFGAAIGESLRSDYYNSPLPHSLGRLASTILENTLFTREVLDEMLRRQRIAVGVYFAAFVLFASYRGTPTNWLLFLSQIVFSGDVLLHWLKMERYRFRTSRVHEQLRQFYLQGGSSENNLGKAIILASFADYECAKDEAGMPTDSAIFEKINQRVSVMWENLKKELGIEAEVLAG